MVIRSMRKEELPLLHSWATREGWGPAESDMPAYFSADPSGIFCMEMEGQVVAMIGGMRWACDYGSIAIFMVEESKRGKGIGKLMWERVMQFLEGVQCVGLFAVRDKVPMYEKWGFVVHTSVVTCLGQLNLAALASSRTGDESSAQNGVQVFDLSQVSWEKLVKYDSQHFPCARPNLLQALLKQPGALVAVATNQSGDVIGLGRVRAVPLGEGSSSVKHRINPLFAESSEIARLISAELCSGLDGQTVQIDVPEGNEQGLEFARHAGLFPKPSCVYMYKGSLPGHPTRNIFSYSNMEFG